MKRLIVIIVLMLATVHSGAMQNNDEMQQQLLTLQQQIEQYPDSAELHFVLGKLFFQCASRGDESKIAPAKTQFKTVLQLQPDHTAALCWQGCLTVIKARYASFPPIKGYYVIAGLGKMDKAVKQEPNMAECRYIRGQTCLQLPVLFNRLDTAIEDYRALDRLAQQSPDAFGAEEQADILYTLGSALERKGDSAAAADCFARLRSQYSATVSAQKLDKE